MSKYKHTVISEKIMLKEKKSETRADDKKSEATKVIRPLSVGLEKTSLNRKFNTNSFSSHRKEVNKVNKDYIRLMRKCSQVIAFNLVSTEAGMNEIQEKMYSAKEKGKNSTNIYEVDLYQRILSITESYIDHNGDRKSVENLYNIGREEIEKGYVEYTDVNGELQTTEASDNVGISVVDLIKGPRGDEKWMLRNRVQTVPEILRDSFRSSCTSDVMAIILVRLNNEREPNSEELTLESFSGESWKKMVSKYVEENNFVFPEIYYHFNRHWNANGAKKGKFAIELDWSGADPNDHAGVRAGRVSNRNNRNRKSFSSSEHRTRRRRTRNSQKEVTDFV